MKMVTLKSLEPLFVLELANNHNGSVGHAKKIVNSFCEVCLDFPFKFGFKMQYRHLDTLIHPNFRQRKDLKYVKRFTETELKPDELKLIKDKMAKLGFVTICTPYDEYSVDLCVEHGFDIIKVASCSFTDWLLWERIAETDKPIIASTAGATVDDMEKVVSFLEHRQKDFALMHCVAEYPTPDEYLQLKQIDFIKRKFPSVIVGYSTHENPKNIDAIKIAIAKGATIFEKHVGLPMAGYDMNAYSVTPEQFRKWLNSAYETYKVCGLSSGSRNLSKSAMKELHALRRGIFAKMDIAKELEIKQGSMFFALPTCDGQFTANDASKYAEFTAKANIKQGEALTQSNTARQDAREKVYEIVKQVRELVKGSGVVMPQKVDMEISHHYGLDKFSEFGCTIFTVVNREYCKKLIVLLPNQKHPEQFHEKKEETFNILFGDLKVSLDGKESEYGIGDVVIVGRGVRHSMKTEGGCIIEEISSTHYVDDSFYSDETIMANKDRKTQLTYWMG